MEQSGIFVREMFLYFVKRTVRIQELKNWMKYGEDFYCRPEAILEGSPVYME